MAATYTAGSTANRDRLRLLIGDAPVGGGGFKGDENADFQDSELDDILVQESDNLNLSGALALEILASRKARDFDFTADGSSFKKSSVPAMLMKRARQLRMRGRGVSVVMPQRVDGYSSDVASDAVNASGGGDFDRPGL
jgi:hypothetical protein